ncbi:hypothetical protein [Sunxiuqinia rutila]|uniref:hypothetical protein n=1 Tax=Sunxiuqinia rutila TaxID=1397841 RepID=UPI003D36E89B
MIFWFFWIKPKGQLGFKLTPFFGSFSAKKVQLTPFFEQFRPIFYKKGPKWLGLVKNLVGRLVNPSGKVIYFSGSLIYLSGRHVYLSGSLIYLSGKHIYLSGKVIYLSGKHIYQLKLVERAVFGFPKTEKQTESRGNVGD